MNMIRFGFVAIVQIKSYEEDIYHNCSYLNYTTVCAVVIKGTARNNIMKTGLTSGRQSLQY